jgi:hypothetical protein
MFFLLFFTKNKKNETSFLFKQDGYFLTSCWPFVLYFIFFYIAVVCPIKIFFEDD